MLLLRQKQNGTGKPRCSFKTERILSRYYRQIHNETVEHENFRQAVIESIGKMEQDVSKNSDLIQRIIAIMEGDLQRSPNPHSS